MQSSRITLLSWTTLVVALCAWGLVGYSVWTIMNGKEARASANISSEQAALRQTTSLRVHALARDTKEERAALDAYANHDVLSIVNTIEQVGKDAGVEIDMGQGLAPGDSPTSAVHTISFIVEARGTFADVMHAATLLHSLAIPSKVEGMDFELVTEGGGSKSFWRLTTRMEVLTIAQITS